MKAIFTTLCFMLTFSLFAQFSGYYDPANWTTTNTGCGAGSVDATAAPASVTVTGAEVGGFCSSLITYGIAVQFCGTVNFNWDYTTTDCDGPFYDQFGYSLNGNYVQLTDNGGANTQSGSASVTVNAGDVFAFYIFSVDSYCGAAWTTVSSFSAPDAVCYGDDGTPKVQVCHKGKTICIAPDAVPAHLAHGDSMGSCEQNAGCGQDLTNSDGSRDEITTQADALAQIKLASDKLYNTLSQANSNKVKANQIYPNPGRDIVSIKLDRMQGSTTVLVYDLNGQLVQKNVVDVVRGLPFQLNVRNLAEGTYSVRFQSAGGGSLTEKMVIIHPGN